MSEPQRGRGRPRTEPSEVQRRRILDAARQLLAEHGFDATTVAAIATQARVARAAVYETVGGKEQIVAAVADELVEDLVERLRARQDAGGPVDPLGVVIRDDVSWFLELVRSDPSMALVIELTGSFAAGTGMQARRRVEDGLTDLYRHRAAQWGLARSEGARLLAVLILGLMERAAFRMAAETGWPADATAEVVADFIAGGVLHVERGDTSLDAFDQLAVPVDGEPTPPAA